MRGSWPTKTVGEVCQIRGGGTPSTSVAEYWNGDIPWVSPKDMKSAVVSDAIDHISHVAIDGSATTLIPKNAVLMVVRSGILARTVPIAITGRDLAINQDLKALCPDRTVDVRFLYYLLESKMGVLLSMVSRGATVHRLMTEQIRTLDFIQPPLADQRRIVGILDEAFEGIATATANAEKNLENARALFESELNAVFTRRGEGWDEVRLGEIANFKNGLNYSSSSNGQTVPVVGVGDFQRNYVVPVADLESVTIDGALHEYYQLRAGDIVTVRSNGSKDLVGRCMLVPDVHEGISYSGFVIRIRPDISVICPRLLLHFMKSSTTRHRLVGGGQGANISNINQGKLSALPLSLPPVDTQERLADELDELMEEAEHLWSVYQRKVEALDELKKSLLHEAFSGNL